MHEDLLTALDDDRMDEEEYKYKYPEHENETKKKVVKKEEDEIAEDIKLVPKEENKDDNTKENDVVDDDEAKSEKKKKLIIIILGVVFGIIFYAIYLFCQSPFSVLRCPFFVMPVPRCSSAVHKNFTQEKDFPASCSFFS